jgi:hypothetical protein
VLREAETAEVLEAWVPKAEAAAVPDGMTET